MDVSFTLNKLHFVHSKTMSIEGWGGGETGQQEMKFAAEENYLSVNCLLSFLFEL